MGEKDIFVRMSSLTVNSLSQDTHTKRDGNPL